MYSATWSLNQVVKYLVHPRTEDFGPYAVDQRNHLLRDSLEIAAARLTGLQGPDREKWSWGALHQVRFRHPSTKRPARRPDGPGPVARPGDEKRSDATGYVGADFIRSEFRRQLSRNSRLSDWDNPWPSTFPAKAANPGARTIRLASPLDRRQDISRWRTQRLRRKSSNGHSEPEEP